MAKEKATAEQFEPLEDLILVIPEKQKENVIVVNDAVKKALRTNRGMVHAVGEGKYDNNGKLIPMRLKVGDVVMFHPNGYDVLSNSEQEFYLMRESAVMVRIK